MDPDPARRESRHEQPRQETENDRKVGDERSSAPEPKENQDTQPQRPAGGRGRRARRGGDRGAGQAELFDAAPGQDASQARGEEAAGDAKKSRSKRRRERRKTAQRADGLPPLDPEKAEKSHPPKPLQPPGRGSGQTADAPGSRPRPVRPNEGHRGPRPDIRRPEGRRPDPRGQADGGRRMERGPAARDPRDRARPDGSPRDRSRAGEGRFDQQRRGGRPQPSASGHRGRYAHPEGLPPLTEEDLEAVGRAGLGDGSNPRYGSGFGGPGGMAQTGVRTLETLTPPGESLSALAVLEGVLEEAAPLSPKHRAGLRGDIRALWEELTSEREHRSSDYLSTPPALSAYLRYFLPWNLFRLSSIFSNADFCLPDNGVVIDIGSGPLTVPIALWMSRPELREVPLTFYCLDRVERVLEAGKNVFETLCMRVSGRLPPWKIEIRKESFGASLPERAHLLTAANVFNEFFWKEKGSLGERALETAHTLMSYLRENGSLFIMEPGDPRSASLISALRAALLAEGAAPLGPCPHSLSCPMPGVFRHLLPPEETRQVKGDPNVAPSRFVLPPVAMPKKRDKFPWCHFGLPTTKAPAWLTALSDEAGLPKEKVTLSFLWAARGSMVRPSVGMPESSARPSERERRARAGRGILVRVVSDPFTVQDGSTGQYACSSLGYTMLKRTRGQEPFDSGTLLEITTSPLARNDEKSGAIVLPS